MSEAITAINTENPILKRILKLQDEKSWECDKCEFSCDDFNELNKHSVIAHNEQVDPLRDVKKLYLNKDKHRLTIGELFGSRITSRHNQNAILNIVGKQGMGKSNAALYIATETAKWIAHKLGGKPEDYFTINNCAIMELDTIIPIVKNVDKLRYNIFILDDIGASYGARDYQNVVNKAFNKIIQTFRDSNTLVILTMPDDFLIDKVPRKLAHFQIEMTTQIFHKSVSIGKLSEVKEIYKAHKTIYPFVCDNGVKYTRCMFKLVEGPLHEEYNRRRTEIRKRMTADCLNTVEEATNQIAEGKVKAVPKYQKISEEAYNMKQDNPELSQRKIAEKIGCDVGTVGKALKFAKQQQEN
jgi:hypothetical protein